MLSIWRTSVYRLQAICGKYANTTRLRGVPQQLTDVLYVGINDHAISDEHLTL